MAPSVKTGDSSSEEGTSAEDAPPEGLPTDDGDDEGERWDQNFRLEYIIQAPAPDMVSGVQWAPASDTLAAALCLLYKSPLLLLRNTTG